LFSDAFDSGVCAAWLLRQSTQLGASFFFHGDDSHVFLPLPNLLDFFPGLMDVDGWMLPMDLLLFHLSDPGGLIRVHGLQFFTDICSSLNIREQDRMRQSRGPLACIGQGARLHRAASLPAMKMLCSWSTPALHDVLDLAAALLLSDTAPQHRRRNWEW
jgi:hypothetical protein